MFFSDGVVVLVLALLWDTFLGEPPAWAHPVIWMGKIVELFKKYAPKQNPHLQLIYGFFGVLVAVAMVYEATYWLVILLRLAPAPGRWLIEAYLLKGCFSLRMLAEVGLKIARLLKFGDLTKARFEMRSLVSRDTSRLNEDLIVAAIVESIAENTTDSFVSPLFFFFLLGLPGVIAYRLVNTFDSMVGYRGKYEFLGKTAARLDDVLNFIPARLTALLFVLNAPFYDGDSRNAWRIMLRDRKRTASPNAGWTMAAMAGALHVRLEKNGHYSLGDEEALLLPSLVPHTVKAMYLVSLELSFVYLLFNLVF